MQHASPNLQLLAERAGQGDPVALARLRQELEPSMVHIVRRYMRVGPRLSPLARRIQATAHALGDSPDAWPQADRQVLVDQVAQRLCDSVCGRLRARPELNHRLADTVRNAG